MRLSYSRISRKPVFLGFLLWPVALFFSSPAYAETKSEVGCIQESLNRLGYDVGAVDGIAGQNTRQALERFKETYLYEDLEVDLTAKNSLAWCARLNNIQMKAVAIPVGSGIVLEGFYHTPIGAGKDTPAIIVLHGFNGSGSDANYSARLLNTQGYAVLSLSMRGWGKSGGEDDCGLMQSSDITKTLDWLESQSGVDPNRIGVLGYSQGGQVALLSAAFDSRIKTAVAFYAPTSMGRWAETSTNRNIPRYINEVCGPDTVSRSPIEHTEAISSPVLLVHGTSDGRVPIEQSISFRNRMKQSDNEATLLIVPGANHIFSDEQWEYVWPEVENFLSIHLAGLPASKEGAWPEKVVLQEDTVFSAITNFPFIFIGDETRQNILELNFSPSCGSCYRDLKKVILNLADTTKDQRILVRFTAKNDSDVKIVTNLFCSHPGRLLGNVFKYISDSSRIEPSTGVSERELMQQLLEISQQISISSGTSNAESKLCHSSELFQSRLIAPASIKKTEPELSPRIRLTPEEARGIISKLHSGGIGNGPSGKRLSAQEKAALYDDIAAGHLQTAKIQAQLAATNAAIAFLESAVFVAKAEAAAASPAAVPIFTATKMSTDAILTISGQKDAKDTLVDIGVEAFEVVTETAFVGTVQTAVNISQSAWDFGNSTTASIESLNDAAIARAKAKALIE